MQLWSRHSLIEKRAAQIDDPVERLRYLRETMKPLKGEETTPSIWLKAFKSWKTPGSWVMLSFVVLSLGLVAWRPGHTNVKADVRGEIRHSVASAPIGRAAPLEPPATVWLVETRDGFENYSNGLRVDNKFAVANEPREKYPVYAYPSNGKPTTEKDNIVEWRTAPSGLVFHTTESHLAPFQPSENRHLVRLGMGAVEYAKDNRFYHFLIDRFGRVFRIVNESDIANHAGNSVWGDDKGAYINLNSSFLGISFESASVTEDNSPAATPAQIHSGRVLTEMLRSKYKISAQNCVTHAQVSVNPSNMLIGWHTDWAGLFPFADFNLPDNYTAPPASLYAFGFNYDGSYVKITGDRVQQALTSAQDRLRREAAASGKPLPKYRAELQKRYRDITAALKAKSSGKEKSDEI